MSSGLSVAPVIIAARNAAATLEEQLDALAGQTYRVDSEIIVGNNGTTVSSGRHLPDR